VLGTSFIERILHMNKRAVSDNGQSIAARILTWSRTEAQGWSSVHLHANKYMNEGKSEAASLTHLDQAFHVLCECCHSTMQLGKLGRELLVRFVLRSPVGHLAFKKQRPQPKTNKLVDQPDAQLASSSQREQA
jgi:hypothetical protein